MRIILWKLILFSVLGALSLSIYAQEWQCYVIDKKGHVWGSAGMTQDHANAVALSFCTAYSPDSSSCHLSKCVVKG